MPAIVSAPTRQLQAIVDSVEARVVRGGAQRLVVNIEGQRSWHAQSQRAQRKHARACSHVEHSGWVGDLDDVVERFETQRSRRVQSRAEGRRVDQPDGVGGSKWAGTIESRPIRIGRWPRTQIDPVSLPTAGETEISLISSAITTCSSVRLSGSRAAHASIVGGLDIDRAQVIAGG
jgi:hypothetical protein